MGPLPAPVVARNVATRPQSSSVAGVTPEVPTLRTTARRLSSAYLRTTASNDSPHRCRNVAPWLCPWSDRMTNS